MARKVLRAQRGTAPLLGAMLYDDTTGGVRLGRLSAMMNAALGYVAQSQEAAGFVDFDAVPSEGASLQVGRGAWGGGGGCIQRAA